MPFILVADIDLSVTRHGDEVWVVLKYPHRAVAPIHGRAEHIVVDQDSTRSSDGLRITYDYDRDGYVIEQSTGAYDKDSSLVWVESVFLKAWAKNVEGNSD